MVARTSVFRFALAKFLYLNAKNAHTILQRVISIHNLDLAIEITLKTIATELGVSLPHNVKFPDLWDSVEHGYKAKFGKTLPLKAEINRIHESRNAVQHNGSVPSDTDLNQDNDYTFQFLNEVLLTVTGLGLHQLFLSSILDNTEIRSMMEMAESNISGDPKISMHATMKSFMWGKILVQRQLGYFDPTLGAFDSRNRIHQAMKEPISAVVSTIVERLFDIELGIDPASYSVIQRIAPHPFLSGGTTQPSNVPIADTLASNYQEDNAWTCYNFVLENLLRWQQAGLL